MFSYNTHFAGTAYAFAITITALSAKRLYIMNIERFKQISAELGIGDTPLIPYEEDYPADIYIKNEAMNAGGSIKDRAALAMVLSAEEQGILHKGDTIVEATSGNMGISLAYVGVKLGYKVELKIGRASCRERVLHTV